MPHVVSAPLITSGEWHPYCQPGSNCYRSKIPSYHLLFWTTPGTSSYRLGSPNAHADICRNVACGIFIRDPHLWKENKEKLGREKSPNVGQVCQSFSQPRETSGTLITYQNCPMVGPKAQDFIPLPPSVTWHGLPQEGQGFGQSSSLYSRGKSWRNWQWEVVYWQYF